MFLFNAVAPSGAKRNGVKFVEQTLPTPRKLNKYAALAQLVEQGTENPCVLGSIPRCGTTLKDSHRLSFLLRFCLGIEPLNWISQVKTRSV